MRRVILKFLTAIQLTRLTMAFGAVSDVWFMILVVRAVGTQEWVVCRLPLWGALGAGFVVAIGLFAFGAALNDVLDAKRDRAFSPDRPIPAGRIRVGQAIVVVAGSLMAAVLGGIALGQSALVITVLTGAGILLYNAAGKFVPAAGVVMLGLIHASHILIPAYAPPTLLPVMLVMTHAMVIGAVVYRLEDKRPRISRRAMVVILLGWWFWMAVLIGAGERFGLFWPKGQPMHLIYPLIAVVVFIGVVTWKASRVGGRSAAEKVRRYGAMWQSLYGSAWLMAMGLTQESVWIGILALCGFVTMTILKEVHGLSGQPIGYRA